jgi:O-antigen/teichoic acid export membrane protein
VRQRTRRAHLTIVCDAQVDLGLPDREFDVTTNPPPPEGKSRWQYLRLRPHYTNTPEGRAAERYRRAALGVVANVASRVVGMALMVLTVHQTTPYLGAERFGVWATFASFAAMLSFMDLGIGNALINRVAHSAAADDSRSLRSAICGGVGWLALVGVLMWLGLSILASFIPWTTLFKLSSPGLGSEARSAALVFSGLFGLHLLSSGLLKVLIGQQRSFEAHMISALGALIACAAMWWTTEQRLGVPSLLLAGFGVQSISGLIVVPMLYRRGWLVFGQLWARMLEERKALWRTGSMFLALQIGTMIGWGSDNLLLASLGGASQVAAFAVVQRLFQFASQPAAVLNAPLWAAYADAHARGDTSSVRRTLVRTACWCVLGGAVVCALLWSAGPGIIRFWTQGAVSIPEALLALYAAWVVIEIAGTVFGTYLNGNGVVREQFIVVTVFCLAALPLKAWATLQFGATGLVAATICSYSVVVIGMYTTVFRRQVLKPLRRQPTPPQATA